MSLDSMGKGHTRIYIAISVHNWPNATYRHFHRSVHSGDACFTEDHKDKALVFNKKRALLRKDSQRC